MHVESFIAIHSFIFRYLAGEDDEDNNSDDDGDDDDSNDDDEDDHDYDEDISTDSSNIYLDTKAKLVTVIQSFPDIANLEPIYGNFASKPVQEPKNIETTTLLRCPYTGCSKVYKTQGGLDRHVAKKH